MRDRKGQVLVGFKCEPAFQQEIVSAAGGLPISQFLRDAIIEKLHAMQMHVDPALAQPRSRLGKGGPKPKKKVKIIQHGAGSIAIGGDFKSASVPAQEPVKKPKGKRGKGESEK